MDRESWRRFQAARRKLLIGVVLLIGVAMAISAIRADNWAGLFAALLIVWAVMGGASVLVLWRLYWVDRSYRRRHNMPAGFVTLTLAVGASVTFAAAAWAAFLQTRRLVELPLFEWSAMVTVPLLLLALSVPIGFAVVVLYQRYRT